MIGAYQDDTAATDAGSAYVYNLTSATPTVPLATLNNAGPAVDDRFGTSVAISGTLVVAGAPREDTSATDGGAAYVYDLNSASPTVPVWTLINPRMATGDNFGASVAISGTRVVVGTPSSNVGANDAGSAYVYDLNGASPTTAIAILDNPDAAPLDNFGTSVAISGSRVVVGAPNDDTGASGAGRAYVYDLAGSSPTVPVTLNNPGPSAGERFGIAVAIEGTQVVVGAFGEDTDATVAGRVYIYDVSGAPPTSPALTLSKPSPQTGDAFGGAVAISGSRVVVAAQGDDTGAPDAGSAYVFDLTGATPTVPVATLNNPTPAGSDLLGSSVAISGTRVAVGVAFDDTQATEGGIGYVYNLSSATPNVPVATLNNPAPTLNDNFGGSVGIAGTRVVAGAPFDDTPQADKGSIYVFSALVTPTLVTQASASAALGGTISDTATLSGGSNPTGTITFNLYGPDDATCSGASVFVSAVPVTGNAAHNSGNFSPSAAGTYRWVASYGGDSNNQPVSGACNDSNESVVVTKGTPSATVSSSNNPSTFGESVTFTATFTSSARTPTGHRAVQD